MDSALAIGAAEVDQEHRDFYVRMLERLDMLSSSKSVAPWLEANTRLNDKAFSFHEHEFQIDIANEDAAQVIVKKCSQVGLSELSVRVSLALLAMQSSLSLIYVLPSARFANEFSKARIDPVIEDSDKLSSLLVTSANSATMKRFARSTLYVGGAANQKQAISRPAQIVVYDEFDFCNMMVLTSYSSRLRHAKNPREIKFSTPTVGKFGISAEYDASSRKRYLVKCLRCNHEQAPDWNSQVTIPGFDLEFKDFSKEDLLDPRYDVPNAYIRCAKCGGSLDLALADSARRRWVSEFPTRASIGYAVKPFDLIAYNHTVSVIMQLAKYSRLQDYYNFVLGEEHSTDENEFKGQIIKNNSVVRPLHHGDDFYMGIDVGKYCHYMIGKRVDDKLVVVKKGKVTAISGSVSIKEQLAEIYEAFNCVRGVIDIAPEYHLGLELRNDLGELFHQGSYIKGNEKDKGHLSLNEDSGVISIARTRAFDQLCLKVNKGKVLFPADGDEEDMATHAEGMKRVDQEDETGKRKAQWVKVGEGNDHYLHALLYLDTATLLDDPTGLGDGSIAMLPMVATVGIGSSHRADEEGASAFSKLFGVR